MSVLGPLLALAISSCGPSKPLPKPVSAHWDLFASPYLEKWQEASIPRSGGIAKKSAGFVCHAGAPMTGLAYATWVQDGLPVTDYAVDYDAMRVSGHDFFGSLTFPVRDSQTFVTFVLGGWGGAQVGISSIDGYDASENTTGSSQRFENDKWYHVRIEARTKEIRVLLDGKPIIQTNILSRNLSLRAGDIDKCIPFGFATYNTEGRVQGCRVERLVTEER